MLACIAATRWVMRQPGHKYGDLSRFMPRPDWSVEDRRRWWSVQFCAHAALVIMIVATIFLLHALLDPREPLIVDRGLLRGALDLLLPGLLVVQIVVPAYLKYLAGEIPFWKFLAPALIVAGVGLCFFPVYLIFVTTLWAKMMLVFTAAISGLMLVGMLLTHLLYRLFAPKE